MIQYLLETIAFQLVFLMVYDLFLKKETFFQWNRAYLLTTFVLSLVLPGVNIEALKVIVPIEAIPIQNFYGTSTFLRYINHPMGPLQSGHC